MTPTTFDTMTVRELLALDASAIDALSPRQLFDLRKRTSVAADCLFHLNRAGKRDLPVQLEYDFDTLYRAVIESKREKPAHRKALATLRNQLRTWLGAVAIKELTEIVTELAS